MKLTEAQLKEMIKKSVNSKLNEMTEVDTRISQLDRLKRETGLGSYELLEDILEQLDDTTWKLVMAGLRHKYGYRK